jgi:hypothetical protein
MASTPASFVLPGLLGLVVGFGLASLLFSGHPGADGPPPSLDNAATGAAGAGDGLERGASRLSGSVGRAETRSAGTQDALRIDARTIQRAIERVEVEQAGADGAVAGGNETLTGIVVGELGEPMADVLILATPRTRSEPYGEVSDRIGRGEPDGDSLQEQLQRRAAGWAERRLGRLEGRTGPDGQFTIRGARDITYEVEAFREGWIFDAEPGDGLRPGGALTLIGRQVVAVECEVRLPDGTTPEVAAVRFVYSRSPRVSAETTLRWTAATPVLRLPWRSGTLQAFADYVVEPEARGSAPVRYRSREVQLTSDDTRVVLQLEGTRGLWGQVRFEAGAFDSNPRIKVLPIDGVGMPGRRELVDRDDGPELWIDRAGGFYEVGDLDAGTYAVAVLVRDAVVWAEPVEVGEELTRCDIVVEAPDPGSMLRVVCTDARGAVVRGVEFRARFAQQGGDPTSLRLAVRHDPDGSYWIATDSLVPDDEEFDELSTDAKIELFARHVRLGTEMAVVRPGMSEVRIRYGEPCRLLVTVSGDAGLRAGETFQVAISPSGADEGPFGGTRVRVEGGRAVFDGLSPGGYEVVLEAAERDGIDWHARPLAKESVTLTGGDQAVSLIAPPLHTVVVQAVGFESGAELMLFPVDEDEWQSIAFAYVGEDGTARFTGIAAGDFRLTARDSDSWVEVTVPGGPVELVNERHDCMRVAISTEDGKLYEAGLRAGDLIVAVGDVELGPDDLRSTFRAAMNEPDAKLVVLRGGQRIELSPPAGEAWSFWGGDVGGSFETAKRP